MNEARARAVRRAVATLVGQQEAQERHTKKRMPDIASTIGSGHKGTHVLRCLTNQNNGRPRSRRHTNSRP